jgi:hypothetical protein
MRFQAFSFGSIRIDGVTYPHDVVIDREHVRKRKKKPSKKFREAFGHTPLSIEEDIRGSVGARDRYGDRASNGTRETSHAAVGGSPATIAS